MISITDLPQDDSGLIPAGLWLAALRDNLSDGFAGMTFQDGLLTSPITGRMLVRLVATMSVVGALRVEGGDPCEVGDVSRMLFVLGSRIVEALDVVKTVEPVTVPVAEPVAAQQAAPEPEGSPSTPVNQAELYALSETQLRTIAEEMGATDKRWKLQKLRNFIADELGIDLTDEP